MIADTRPIHYFAPTDKGQRGGIPRHTPPRTCQGLRWNPAVPYLPIEYLVARTLCSVTRLEIFRHRFVRMTSKSGAPRGNGCPSESRFRSNLLAWFDRHKRDLPWRLDRDPYRIWISEVMLQQTRVAAAVDHYHRFLQRFPTVEKLAAARDALGSQRSSPKPPDRASALGLR